MVDRLVSAIKETRNANVLSFYGTSSERLLGNVANMQYLQEFDQNYKWDQHILLYYDCDNGEEYFERTLSAGLARYFYEDDLFRQVYEAIAAGKKISLILANYRFGYKVITNLANLIAGLDRRLTHFIVHMHPGEYYSHPGTKYSPRTVLSHNIIKLPYLNEDEAEEWINILVKNHGYRLTAKDRQQVINFSGGVPSLIRNLVRELQRSDFETVINSEPIVNLVNIIWHRLQEDEREELESVIINKSTVDQDRFAYFEDFGLTENGRYKSQWLKKIAYPAVEKHELRLEQGKLKLAGKGISKIFSVQEQILISELLGKRGERVSRDELISRIWGKNVENPDWLLNQLVLRTRSKLALIGLPSRTIQVSRGYGYKIE